MTLGHLRQVEQTTGQASFSATRRRCLCCGLNAVSPKNHMWKPQTHVMGPLGSNEVVRVEPHDQISAVVRGCQRADFSLSVLVCLSLPPHHVRTPRAGGYPRARRALTRTGHARALTSRMMRNACCVGRFVTAAELTVTPGGPCEWGGP